MLHIGHIKYLKAAKSHGDVLVVGVENDQTIKLTRVNRHTALHIKRPYYPASDRMFMLACLECVDFVFELPQTVKDYTSTASQKIFQQDTRPLSHPKL